MHRIAHITVSFAIVVVAYWCYALIAVPLIEPAGPIKNPGSSNTAGAAQFTRRQTELEKIFPPGSWELDDALVLQGEQFKLLFKRYENQGDGVVEIKPCTMVFTPDNSASAAGNEQKRSAAPIILQSPQGASLTFDEAINLKGAKLGKLIGGSFNSRVTVFSHGTKPGEEDDLMFIADDMHFNENEAYTQQRVQFRYGAHYGSGRRMRVKLAKNADGDGSNNSRKPSIGGVESLEITDLEQFHLEIPDRESENGATDLDSAVTVRNSVAGKTTTARTTKAKAFSVEVRCCGPLRIDLVDDVITFEDHVQVRRFYASGPSDKSDQIDCELLSIWLAAKSDAAEKAPLQIAEGEKHGEATGLDEMELRRIEAVGNPVIVRAPQHDMQARGQRLQYDLAGHQILLERRQPAVKIATAGEKGGNHTLSDANGHTDVFLSHGANEIHAVSLQYEFAKSQRQIGKLVAQGPGWFRGRFDGETSRSSPVAAQPGQSGIRKRSPQFIEGSWSGLLRLRPDNQYQAVSPEDKFHTISLGGKAVLDFPGFGCLRAEEIHFWMLESVAEGESGLRPHSMLAQASQASDASTGRRNKVKIHSPQLTAVVDKLQAWFAAAAPVAVRTQADKGPRNRPQTAPAARTVGVRIAAEPHNVDVQGAIAPKTPNNHFHIVGELLKADVALGNPTELSTLTISGGVRLNETKTTDPGDVPIVVEGEEIVVRNASRPYASVIVSGTPGRQAQFHGRGLGLIGASINLNRGTNRLWMDCPGMMILPPMSRDLQGHIISGGDPLRVEWRDGMEFDGRTASFEQSVVASSANHCLHTETLKVCLERMVDFDQSSRLSSDNDQPEVQEVYCRGGVSLESRSFDEQGLLSREWLTAADLRINTVSGNIYATGPGTVRIVRRGSPQMNILGGMPGPAPRAPLSAAVSGPYASSANRDVQPNAINSHHDTNATSDPGISYLNVNFQEKIKGNIFQRRIEFYDQIKAVYGPVDAWKAQLPDDDPDALGPDGALLSCRRLAVTSLPSPVDKKEYMEMEAVGNATIEGALFTARGARVSFNQEKDLLILEGDGRNPASLYHQQIIGGPEQTLHAQRIYYRPQNKATAVEGAQSVELHLEQHSLEHLRGRTR